MSTKVQPASDAGNSASDGDVVDPGERLSRRQLAEMHGDCARRREHYFSVRSSDRAVVTVQFDRLPGSLRGPVRDGPVWTDLSPVEQALAIMTRELNTCIHTASEDVATQRELAATIIEAAYRLTAHRHPCFALEKPTPANVCALFDVAARTVEKLLARVPDRPDTVHRVALAVAYLRAQHRLHNETLAAANEGREPDVSCIGAEQTEFARRFENALGEYLCARSANASASAMFRHFDTKAWVGDEALRKALRKRVSRMDEFQRRRAMDDLLYYADRVGVLGDPVASWALMRAQARGSSGC